MSELGQRTDTDTEQSAKKAAPFCRRATSMRVYAATRETRTLVVREVVLQVIVLDLLREDIALVEEEHNRYLWRAQQGLGRGGGGGVQYM